MNTWLLIVFMILLIIFGLYSFDSETCTDASGKCPPTWYRFWIPSKYILYT